MLVLVGLVLERKVLALIRRSEIAVGSRRGLTRRSGPYQAPHKIIVPSTETRSKVPEGNQMVGIKHDAFWPS